MHALRRDQKACVQDHDQVRSPLSDLRSKAAHVRSSAHFAPLPTYALNGYDNDLPPEPKRPVFSVSNGEMPYSAKYGHDHAENPFGYHTAAPRGCDLRTHLHKMQTDLIFDVPALPASAVNFLSVPWKSPFFKCCAFF